MFSNRPCTCSWNSVFFRLFLAANKFYVIVGKQLNGNDDVDVVNLVSTLYWPAAHVFHVFQKRFQRRSHQLKVLSPCVSTDNRPWLGFWGQAGCGVFDSRVTSGISHTSRLRKLQARPAANVWSTCAVVAGWLNDWFLEFVCGSLGPPGAREGWCRTAQVLKCFSPYSITVWIIGHSSDLILRPSVSTPSLVRWCLDVRLDVLQMNKARQKYAHICLKEGKI